jgi:hypothetical protein
MSSVWPWSGVPKVRLYDTFLGGLHFAAQFKVLNTPLLIGWNSMMTIIEILDQLQDSYGKFKHDDVVQQQHIV